MTKEKLGLFTESELVVSEVNIKEEADNAVPGTDYGKLFLGYTLIGAGGATAAGGFAAAGV